MADNLAPRKDSKSRSESSPQSSCDSKGEEVNAGAGRVLYQSLKLKKRRSKRREEHGVMSETSTSEGPQKRKSRPSRKKAIGLPRISMQSSIQDSQQSITSSKYEDDDNAGERRSLLADDLLDQNYSGSNQTVLESETANPAEQSQPQSGEPNQSMDSTTDSTADSTTRLLSFVLFLFVLVLGIALVINSKIRTEHGDSSKIAPLVVNIYVMTLICIFGLWYGCDRLVNRKCDVTITEQSGSLIPRHLLNGLVLFGVGSSVCQVVTVLDFLKCQRHVGKLEYSCFVYPFFEMAFMFLQIYVFYALSTNRERKMLYGNAFTMFTLALNLTIWGKYFFASAAGSPELAKELWVAHYYYGVRDHDWCSENATSAISKKLHEFHSGMKPFMYTLAMEYALLASALLLHMWLEIATPNAGAFGATNSKQYKWQIFRFGFIWGLFCLPVLGAIALNVSVQLHDGNTTKVIIIYVASILLFILLSFCSIFGLWYVKKFYIALDDEKPIRLDILLLCISWLGFLVYDLFTMFATCTEVAKHWKLADFGLGVYALCELLTTGLLTTFLATAYSRKLPPTVDRECPRAAKYIRQLGSFCLIVSFGFWAMRTYTFRSKYNFDFVGNRYFKGFSWFVITQLSVPFCTFYHFHSAVCFAEVIAQATI